MKKTNLTWAVYAFVLCSLLSVSACKKDRVINETKMEELDLSKEIRFLSITLGAPLDQVVYDKEKKEFIVYGWYKESLHDLQTRYDLANEYKANYEK
ncbi:hypothetical protein [Pedobacter nototheniae]|uniref:hypothetical protein n=1 Tax=Pedobacter nototheniae TaxID=2488994 RepID=UPI00292E9693|nr:hypothetical protein [Pedobacter nototheniae]